MKPERNKKSKELSQEDRELLERVAKQLRGRDLFPEATADAKRILAKVVSIDDQKR